MSGPADAPAVRSAQQWIGPAIIALTGAIVLACSWGTWPDPLTDAGRELYVPWRLCQGERLYADIAYFNGPLSPYVNALWFKLFGVGIRTLVFANLGLLAILVALIYRVMREISGQVAATASGVIFMLIFAFGQYSSDIDNYNYVLPYSHEATHGLILAFAGLWMLSRYLRTARAMDAVSLGVIIGLTFLTKPEIFLATVLAVGGGFAAGLWLRRASVRSAVTHAGLLVIGAAATVSLAWILLSCAMSPRVAAMGVAGGWPATLNGQVARLPFYREGMGVLSIRSSLWWLAASAAVYAAFAVGVWGLSAASGRFRHLPRQLLNLAALLLVLGAGGWMGSQFVDAGRPLPIAVLIIGSISAIGFLRSRNDDPGLAGVSVMRLSMSILAIVLLLKIILYARTFHYGVFLAMPAAMLVVASLVTLAPQWLRRRGGDFELARFAGIGFCAAAAIVHLAISARQITHKQQYVSAGADSFRADSRALYINEALRLIEQRVSPDRTLAVVPEGAMLNYLARRGNSTPYISVMPPELLMFGERQVMISFQSCPPDFICLVQRDTSEYGSRAFGHGYGTELYGWIVNHYRPVASVGASPLDKLDQVGMVLMERSDAPAQGVMPAP